MTMQKSSHFIIAIGDGGNPESFIPVSGLMARRFLLKSSPVDLSDTTSPGRWRQLASDSGLRQLEVTAEGVFRNGQADRMIRDAFLFQSLNHWQVGLLSFGIFTGAFLVTELDYSGMQESEAGFSLSLSSAASLNFTNAT